MKKILSLLISLFICILTLGPIVAEARWATKDDSEITVESYTRNYVINKDGTYTETIEILAKAVKDGGKDKLVSLPLVYNKRSSKLTILEAKTIKNNVEYPVDLKLIEDKPLASTPQGFDQNNQMLIAFPELSVNATVYIKYQYIVTEPPVPGFFSTDLVYGMGQYCKKNRVHIVSDLPLYSNVHDPEGYLLVKKGEVNKKYELSVDLKKPIIKVPVEEQFIAADSKIYPWVTISTLDSWPKLGQQLLHRYEDILTESLPELFNRIAKEAETMPTVAEKINIITSRLAENITYMGDWRTVEGAYIPRHLNLIVKTKIGDCKDFSAATVAILRRIGLKADVAFVHRGVELYETPNRLPSIEDFNHAFVRVKEGQKTYWIDPTNFTSFAEGIYPDIANRNALVLDREGPALERVPGIDAKTSSLSLFKKIDLLNAEPDLAHVQGEVTMTGVQALSLTGADLRSSKESINHDIIHAVADEGRTIAWKLEPYNLKSRIVHDLKFLFNFTEKHTKFKTTAGNAFILRTQYLINKLLTRTEDRVMGLSLDMPSTYRSEVLLSNASIVGKMSSCSFDSPWVSGSRNITTDKDGIRVKDEIIVKKEKITNAEMLSHDYMKLQTQVYNCFGDTALVYNASANEPKQVDDKVSDKANNQAKNKEVEEKKSSS